MNVGHALLDMLEMARCVLQTTHVPAILVLKVLSVVPLGTDTNVDDVLLDMLEMVSNVEICVNPTHVLKVFSVV